MAPTMLGWIVQWKVPPVPTPLAVLEAPGERLPKSTELSSMTMRWVIVSLFLNITWSPLAVGTGSGTYERLPFVPTIETVTTLGVEVPGLVGVEDELSPPLHRDAETAAVKTIRRINDDRMMLFLPEEKGVLLG
jgi:hypothetical protein